jgi:serine/threonine protein kinase
LKKPFEADNLLGLVFKIVTDEPPPIDTNLPYSKELRALIDQLLTKDPKSRPSIADFLHMPTVKKMMSDYVATKGQTLRGASKVFNKQIPKIQQKSEPDQTNETHKERLAR